MSWVIGQASGQWTNADIYIAATRYITRNYFKQRHKLISTITIIEFPTHMNGELISLLTYTQFWIVFHDVFGKQLFKIIVMFSTIFGEGSCNIHHVVECIEVMLSQIMIFVTSK